MTKLLIFSLLLTSCITRAPSEYELDRRAGLTPSVEVPINEKEILKLEKSHKTTIAGAPVRTSPWIEKVWVYDQSLGKDFWMKGTYIYMEVEPTSWSVGSNGGE
ncbi:MAG: hypothetical protein KBD78_02600 [Oligoflexales bacterium]|nr:hypothetical protein [Oligoflexales bacterium]